MEIFWNRYQETPYPWSDDPVMKEYKFTNVYRACDRVSQYLIRKVVYTKGADNFSEEDILLRILVFKVFNRIDTWEFIEDKLGVVSLKIFDVANISKLLSERVNAKPIFNAAYLMPGSHIEYSNYTSKHERWLRMIENKFIKENLFSKIIKSASLEEVFTHLQKCPFIGDFLAYQYAIDFNYSTVINFDENSFVKAGIGAIRGIKKCFKNTSNYSYEDLIRYTQENLHTFRNRYGYHNFKSLFGREPTLIDLQNCFCETDKYLRVTIPELNVGTSRIKQKYKNKEKALEFFFPPKWGINNNIRKTCLQ